MVESLLGPCFVTKLESIGIRSFSYYHRQSAFGCWFWPKIEICCENSFGWTTNLCSHKIFPPKKRFLKIVKINSSFVVCSRYVSQLLDSCFGILASKIKTFWGGHKIWKKISHLFLRYRVNVKKRNIFFQILWPSKKTLTLYKVCTY